MSTQWYEISVGSFKLKYARISNDDDFDIKYPYCDSKGNLLKRISGKITEKDKAYFLNEATNEKHETALRLVNGTPKEIKFSGRTKEVKQYKEVDKAEVEDMNVISEYLVDNDELYNDLLNSGKALKFVAHFGTGEKALNYCFILPSELYKGFLYMKIGKTFKSDVVTSMVSERTDLKAKAKVLSQVALTIQTHNQAQANELMAL